MKKRKLFIGYENLIWDGGKVAKRDLVLRDEEGTKIWACHTWCNEKSEAMADTMMIQFLDTIEEGVELLDSDNDSVEYK